MGYRSNAPLTNPPPPPKGQSGQSDLASNPHGQYGIKYVNCVHCGAEKLNGCKCNYCQSYGEESDSSNSFWPGKSPPPPNPPPLRNCRY